MPLIPVNPIVSRTVSCSGNIFIWKLLAKKLNRSPSFCPSNNGFSAQIKCTKLCLGLKRFIYFSLRFIEEKLTWVPWTFEITDIVFNNTHQKQYMTFWMMMMAVLQSRFSFRASRNQTDFFFNLFSNGRIRNDGEWKRVAQHCKVLKRTVVYYLISKQQSQVFWILIWSSRCRGKYNYPQKLQGNSRRGQTHCRCIW